MFPNKKLQIVIDGDAKSKAAEDYLVCDGGEERKSQKGECAKGSRSSGGMTINYVIQTKNRRSHVHRVFLLFRPPEI